LEFHLACPFFMPTAKLDDGGWLHPSRLPLGGGWSGRCSAPGHEDAELQVEQLREFCNLGYASGCAHLPQERTSDAVRFSVTRDAGTQLLLQYVCELNHQPAGHGTLEYDCSSGWLTPHPDPRIQRMAECYLESYLLRRGRAISANATLRTTA
jgi:hypothetical protein